MLMAAPAQSVHVDQASFDGFRHMLESRTGIVLAPTKAQFVTARLGRHLSGLGMTSLNEYLQYLESLPQSADEWQTLFNAMTTNKTGFFREPVHFERLLHQVVAAHVQSGRRQPLRVWSAACSSGEEPYTAALVLAKAAQTTPFAFEVLGSDIDSKVVQLARNGVYRREALGSVPEDYRKFGFQQGTGTIAQWVKVRPEIKQHVTFELKNLLEPAAAPARPFDVIFCRNVMIYFSPEAITKVVNALYDAARPGAHLFIGHSESLHKLPTKWRYLAPAVYVKD